MRVLYSTLFWTFLALASIVMFAGALVLFVLVGPFDPLRRAQHCYSCFWAQIFFYVNMCEPVSSGKSERWKRADHD